jgi:hypothetical protein
VPGRGIATTSYHYDSFNRLCWYATGDLHKRLLESAHRGSPLTYDANGNRLSMISGGTATSYRATGGLAASAPGVVVGAQRGAVAGCVLLLAAGNR